MLLCLLLEPQRGYPTLSVACFGSRRPANNGVVWPSAAGKQGRPDVAATRPLRLVRPPSAAGVASSPPSAPRWGDSALTLHTRAAAACARLLQQDLVADRWMSSAARAWAAGAPTPARNSWTCWPTTLLPPGGGLHNPRNASCIIAFLHEAQTRWQRQTGTASKATLSAFVV